MLTTTWLHSGKKTLEQGKEHSQRVWRNASIHLGGTPKELTLQSRFWGENGQRKKSQCDFNPDPSKVDLPQSFSWKTL